MLCTCGNKTIVKDSREQEGAQWRRRYCNACGKNFTTLEQVCETLAAKKGKPFLVAPVLKKPRVKAIATLKLAAAKPPVNMPREYVTNSRNRMSDIRMDKEYS